MPYPTSTLFYTRPQAIIKAKSAHSPSCSSSSSSSSEGPKTPPGPSPPSSPVVITKDVRSYEHERQRTKRATDFAKMRTRKGQWSSKVDDSPKDSDAGKLCEWAVRETDSSTERGFLFDFDHDAEPGVTIGSRLEVPLMTLVTTKKARKGREGDFEIIPHVRPVIALDDDMTPDVEVDDPWEHIYGDDDDHLDKEPSYATIASLN